MLSPRWAHRPLSGAGAARNGGRYNPPGTEALYLSEEHATAIAEYQQELGSRPGTLCAYDVAVDGIVDLTDPGMLGTLGIPAADLTAPWKAIAYVSRGVPPTWLLSRRLADLGFRGARVPSIQRRGGANLVLWRWNDGPNGRVDVLDPLDDLPRDQSSWPDP